MLLLCTQTCIHECLTTQLLDMCGAKSLNMATLGGAAIPPQATLLLLMRLRANGLKTAGQWSTALAEGPCAHPASSTRLVKPSHGALAHAGGFPQRSAVAFAAALVLLAAGLVTYACGGSVYPTTSSEDCYRVIRWATADALLEPDAR